MLPNGMRKRKGGAVEALEPPFGSKSRRIFEEDTTTMCTADDSGSNDPLFLGGISTTGRDPQDRLETGAIKGLDLNLLLENDEKEGGMAACDWTMEKTDLHK